MQPAVLIRLRPLGPWRFGAGEGGDHRLDILFRSDRLYSAVTLAMEQLGYLESWLDATVRAETPVATFSSLFPYQGDTLFAPPPATLWPPPHSLLTGPSPVFLTKMRWEAIRFIPLTLVEALVTGQQILADQWVIDAESGCLLRRDRPSQSPFRFSSRPRVAVDRLTSASRQADHAACVEFENGSGLWLTVRFANSETEQNWSSRIQSALCLLADTGFGGRRSSGWGQTAEPEWQAGNWPGILLPKLARKLPDEDQSSLYWLLSLYAPSASDQVNWKVGEYRLTVRGGRVQSRSGSGALKKTARMVTEGSVIGLPQNPVGVAIDVAPDGFVHPVYRSGLALALRLPLIRQASTIEPVESTPPESSLEAELQAALEAERELSVEALPTPPGSADLKDEAEPFDQRPPEAEHADSPPEPEIQEASQVPSPTADSESERSDYEL